MHLSRRDFLLGGAAAVLGTAFSLFPLARKVGNSEVPKHDVRLVSPLESQIGEYYRKQRKEIDFWINDVYHLPSDRAIFFQMKTLDRVAYKGQLTVEKNDSLRKEARAYFKKQGVEGVYYVSGRKSEVTECLENTGNMYSWLHNHFVDDGRSLYGNGNVPPELFWLFLAESLGNPRTVSYAGAHGLWQFMLSTGNRYGLSMTRDVDERHDMIESTKAAYAYLDDLLAMFQDWRLALMGYLTGETNLSNFLEDALSEGIYGSRIKAAIAARGTYGKHLEAELHDVVFKKDRELVSFFKHHNISRPDYDLVYDTLRSHFKEKGYHSLDQYVSMYVAMYLCCLKPGEFGFGDIKYKPQVAYTEMKAKPGISLTRLAEELDVPEELQNEFSMLNSRLRRDVSSASVPLRVPVFR